MNIQHRSAAAIREVNKSARTIEVIASTNSIDRYDSIIRHYWDLSGFEKNPVALWMHSHMRPPIGRVEEFVANEDRSQTTAIIRFAETDFAEEIFRLYEQNILSAVSVGFMPGEMSHVEEGERFIQTMGSPEAPNELYELSAVTVPGNKEAVKLSLLDDSSLFLELENRLDRIEESHKAQREELLAELQAFMKSHGSEDSAPLVFKLTE